METTVDMAARGSSPKTVKTVALRCPWIDLKTNEPCTHVAHFPLSALAPVEGVTGNGPFARKITHYPGIQQYDCPVCGNYTSGNDLRMDNEEVFSAAAAALKAMEAKCWIDRVSATITAEKIQDAIDLAVKEEGDGKPAVH